MLPKALDTQTHLLESQIKGLKDQGHSLKFGQGKTPMEMEKAAKKFEGFVMSFMYKQMYKSIPKSDVFGSRNAEKIFMNMYMDEVSKTSQGNSSGIASMLMKQYEASMAGERRDGLSAIRKSDVHPTKSVTNQLKSLLDKYEPQSVAKLMSDFDQMVSKLEGKISSGYGMREHPIAKKQKMHSGIDIALSEGTDVKAPSSGKVVFAGDKGGYGNAVEVDHGHGVTTLYAHLSKITVKEGDALRKNALLGHVGSTGMSTGPHLHFEVKKDGKALNPLHLEDGVK